MLHEALIEVSARDLTPVGVNIDPASLINVLNKVARLFVEVRTAELKPKVIRPANTDIPSIAFVNSFGLAVTQVPLKMFRERKRFNIRHNILLIKD
tara:strand:- start:110 stop:397 length:288 start_codon:yes stop_codon:yes gene_type:complete